MTLTYFQLPFVYLALWLNKYLDVINSSGSPLFPELRLDCRCSTMAASSFCVMMESIRQHLQEAMWPSEFLTGRGITGLQFKSPTTRH